jgi:hypothetical protein
VPTQLGYRARQIHARRPGTHNNEGQQRISGRGVRLDLGRFERRQDTPQHLERVLQRLQAWREWLPLVMAEIRVARAGGHNDRVVPNAAPVDLDDATLIQVESGDFTHHDSEVGVSAENEADRHGNVGGREGGGRHLV